MNVVFIVQIQDKPLKVFGNLLSAIVFLGDCGYTYNDRISRPNEPVVVRIELQDQYVGFLTEEQIIEA